MIAPSSRKSHLRSTVAVLIALATVACQYDGVMLDETPPPVLDIETVVIRIGETQHHELDCVSGSCQIRFRMLVERPGELVAFLQPTQSGDSVGIIMVLEDPIQRVLDRYNMQDVKPPLIVKSAVQPGPHSVLVQAIGGRLAYDLTVQFRAGGEFQPITRPVRRLQPAAPTRVVEGGNAAFDPDFDFAPMQRYAFAESPSERIEAAAPGESVGNPFLDRQIQLAVQSELANRGYRQSPIHEADFLVDLSVGSHTTTWYSFQGILRADSYDRYLQSWGDASGNVVAHSYQDGTLSLDFINPKDGNLIWHGWSTGPVSRFGDAKEIIHRFVKEVLDRFPPPR